MEVLKILGGLCVIAVVVVLLGTAGGDDGTAASVERPGERTFTSDSSAARFIAVPGD